MELAALEVPIRTTGASQVRTALSGIETAGQKAGRTLEQSAVRTAARAKSAYSKMGSEAVRAINAEANRGRASLERTGQELAQSLTGGLRRQLARQQAEIKEELARGLITPAEAQRRGQDAARAYNRGILQVISQQGAAGAFTGRRGGALFVGLSNQLVGLDRNARRGAVGLRTLASQMASMAAVEIGLRSGFGSMASVLGTLALGSTLTLGVVAGLAAIGLAIKRITQESRDAKDRMKEFRAEGRKLFEDAKRQELSFAEDEATAAKVLADTKAAAAARLRAAADSAAARVERANAKEREFLAIQSQNAAEKAAAAAQDAADARLEMEGRLGRVAELRKKRDEEAQQAAEEAARAEREHIEALAALAAAGRVTGRELIQLGDIQERLRRNMHQGTMAVRAQTAALLDQVAAANRLAITPKVQITPERPLPGREPPGAFLPPTTLRAPAGSIPVLTATAQAVDDLSRAVETFNRTGGLDTLLSALQQLENIGAIPKGTTALKEFQVQLEDMARIMVSLPEMLNLAADAWLGFWESIGAGEGLGESVKKMFTGAARYFAQYFAAKALAAAAEALLPPPLGNPAAAKAIPGFLAASAAFAALAGATGGGRRGGASSGGGGSSLARERFMFEEHLSPRLRPGGTSPTAQTASQVRPVQPQTFNFAVIGPNDPVAQKQIAMLVTNASRRGYRTA